jgi:hypothetical protein
MDHNDDLPKELAKLFGNTIIPPETREALRVGWDKMKPKERELVIAKIRRKSDPFERVLVAIIDATKASLTKPPGDGFSL